MNIRNIILTDGQQRIILRVKPLRINFGGHIYERIERVLSKHKLSLAIAYQFFYDLFRHTVFSLYTIFTCVFLNLIHLAKQSYCFQ